MGASNYVLSHGRVSKAERKTEGTDPAVSHDSTARAGFLTGRAPEARRSVSRTIAILIIVGLGAGCSRPLQHHILITHNDIPYLGGPVMHPAIIYAIFWQPHGYHYNTAAVSGGQNRADRSYENLVMQYFRRVGATTFYHILTQYSTAPGGQPVRNGPIRNRSTFGGMYDDQTPFPRLGTERDPILARDIDRELGRDIQQAGWKARGLRTAFFLFTPRQVEICVTGARTDCTFPRKGTRNWCGRHFFRSIGRQVVPGAVIADLPASDCFPRRLVRDHFFERFAPDGDTAADRAITIASHEEFEMVTDPLFNAWVRQPGGRHMQEIADRCRFDYRPPPGRLRLHRGNVVLRGRPYLLQSEWSNLDRRCVLR